MTKEKVSFKKTTSPDKAIALRKFIQKIMFNRTLVTYDKEN